MIKKVDREHFDSMVICLKTKGALADELIELGFDVHSMNKGEGLELDCFFKLAILLVKEKVDVVHLHNFGAYIYGGVAGILAGFKKMIYTEHGRVFPDEPRRMMAERILSWFTHKIVTVSNNMKECLIKYEKINPQKIQVIYNGVDTSEFRKIEDSNWKIEKKKELGIEGEDVVIGNVARLVGVKDHATLIHAFSLVREKIENGEGNVEKSFKLLIVGDGEELENLKELCQNFKLSCFDLTQTDVSSIVYPRFSVLFARTRMDIPELLNIMDVFVLSSLNEGLSLTLLEAMASKVPVVATCVGGTPEIVRDRINGFLCNVSDAEDMASCIKKAIGFDPLSFDENFSLTRLIEQHELLYKREN